MLILCNGGYGMPNSELTTEKNYQLTGINKTILIFFIYLKQSFVLHI